MSTVQNILNRTSLVADAARSTSTGTGFDAVLAGAIRDDRSATVDRRSQQPSREPVRAEQPDRTRTDRADRNSRPDRPRSEKADRAEKTDRTDTTSTDRTEQSSDSGTDMTGTETRATAPTPVEVPVDPNALVVAAPVETAPTAQLPTEATVIAAEPAAVAPAVVAPAVPATEPTTAPATAPSTTTPVAATAPTAEPATAQSTPAQATTQPAAVPTEPVAPVAEPAVKPAPANAGAQPATAQATPALAQPAAQSTTPAPAESTTPAATPTASTAPTTPVGPAVQVGSVALPTTAVTRESAAPLSDQLAGKLAEQLPGLKAAGPGRHTLSLTVTPEHFGKIQVVAHISAESVRVELVGATDAARDSLRAALPDLRRDLAQSGLSSDVRLGDPNAGTDPRGGQPGLTDSGRRPTGTATPGGLPGEQAAPSSESVPVRTASAAGGLDLLV